MAEKNGNLKRKRLELFNNVEKISLIKAVESEPILWDLNDKRHFDAVHIKSAWGNIATLLNRNANECKLAWKSLRDSYRYHCKASERRNIDEVEWHLAPYLKFLPEIWAHKRSDSTAISPREEGASSSQDRDSDPLGSQSISDAKNDLSFSNLFDIEDSQLDDISCDGTVNSFQKVTPCISKKAKDSTKSQDIIGMLGSFLSKHTELMDQTVLETTSTPPIRPIFEYWEGILKKMDAEKAEAAERAMTDVLWQHENAIVNGTSFKGKNEHETPNHEGANEDHHYSHSSRKRKREDKEITLSRFQRELFRCKNQRAQEMHDFEMHRERTKLDQEVEEGKLRIEMLRLDILEKRDKLNLKNSQ